jgi:hypothetical protein
VPGTFAAEPHKSCYKVIREDQGTSQETVSGSGQEFKCDMKIMKTPLTKIKLCGIILVRRFEEINLDLNFSGRRCQVEWALDFDVQVVRSRSLRQAVSPPCDREEAVRLSQLRQAREAQEYLRRRRNLTNPLLNPWHL